MEYARAGRMGRKTEMGEEGGGEVMGLFEFLGRENHVQVQIGVEESDLLLNRGA